MTEKKWCVYRHTNLVNGKVYIGITCKKPEARWGCGHGYRHNAHMDNAMKKFGWDNFSHEILYAGLSEDEALDTERKLISEYQSADRRYGYNIEAGGRKKGSFSSETLEKMRQRMLGPNNHNYGKPLSEETRRKLSECNSGENSPRWGTHLSEETKKKISESLKGEKCWNYGKKTPEEVKEKMRQSQRSRPVLCVETGVSYRSTREAGRQTGVNPASISTVCRGGRLKTTGGYHWRYIEDSI